MMLVFILLLSGCAAKQVEGLSESQLDSSIWGYDFQQNLKQPIHNSYGSIDLSESEDTLYFTVNQGDSFMLKLDKLSDEIEIYNTDITALCELSTLQNCSSYGSYDEGSSYKHPIYYNDSFYYGKSDIDSETNQEVFNLYSMNMETNDQKKLFEIRTGSDSTPSFLVHQGYLYSPFNNVLRKTNIEDLTYEDYITFEDNVVISNIFPAQDELVIQVEGYKQTPLSILVLKDGEVAEEKLGDSTFRSNKTTSINFDYEQANIYFENFKTGEKIVINDYPNAQVFEFSNYWIIEEIFNAEEGKIIVVNQEGETIYQRNKIPNEFYGLGVVDNYYYSSWRDEESQKVLRFPLLSDEFEILIEFDRELN